LPWKIADKCLVVAMPTYNKMLTTSVTYHNLAKTCKYWVVPMGTGFQESVGILNANGLNILK
jgi:hypothetical protein